MLDADVQRAVAAATAIARDLGLAVDEAIVLHNSNKLAVRLRPCDALARIAPAGQHVAALESEIAQGLARTGSPVVRLDPRIAPRVHARDGFAVTLWTYYPASKAELAPADFARGLAQLHAGMRTLQTATPHFTDRIAEAEQLVADPARTPELADADRALLIERLQGLRQAIVGRGAPEQLLHGEPHAGNVLATPNGPVFIDLETCCRGPVEFDLAHAPEAVAEHYPGLDHALLEDCRALVLAMVAAWRWDAGDHFPNGRRWADRFIQVLREGAPWPSLDALSRRFEAS